jgi:hypothetical protein
VTFPISGKVAATLVSLKAATDEVTAASSNNTTIYVILNEVKDLGKQVVAMR